MNEARLEIVYRRWWNPDRLTTSGVELLWVVELADERVVRRTLVDPSTGEVLDVAWQDGKGRTRSYSRPVRHAKPESRAPLRTG